MKEKVQQLDVNPDDFAEILARIQDNRKEGVQGMSFRIKYLGQGIWVLDGGYSLITKSLQVDKAVIKDYELPEREGI